MADELNNEAEVVETPQSVEEAAAKLYDTSGEKPEEKPEEKAEEKVEDGGKPKDTEDGEKSDSEKQEGAPEEYKDFTMPEGMEVDAGLMEGFKPLAKELNLSQENAQKLVDLYNEKLQETVESTQKNWEEVQKSWGEAAQADKEYGGEKFQENLSLARQALDKFGSEELKEALDVTGTGNHPEFIRFFYHVGKLISEDGVVSGSSPQGQKMDQAHVMFPDMN